MMYISGAHLHGWYVGAACRGRGSHQGIVGSARRITSITVLNLVPEEGSTP